MRYNSITALNGIAAMERRLKAKARLSQAGWQQSFGAFVGMLLVLTMHIA